MIFGRFYKLVRALVEINLIVIYRTSLFTSPFFLPIFLNDIIFYYLLLLNIKKGKNNNNGC